MKRTRNSRGQGYSHEGNVTKQEDHTPDPSRMRTCVDCGKQWEFTEREEAFLKRTFDDYNEPKRCHPCRKLKKERKAAGGNR